VLHDGGEMRRGRCIGYAVGEAITNTNYQGNVGSYTEHRAIDNHDYLRD